MMDYALRTPANSASLHAICLPPVPLPSSVTAVRTSNRAAVTSAAADDEEGPATSDRAAELEPRISHTSAECQTVAPGEDPDVCQQVPARCIAAGEKARAEERARLDAEAAMEARLPPITDLKALPQRQRMMVAWEREKWAAREAQVRLSSAGHRKQLSKISYNKFHPQTPKRSYH